MSNDQKEDSPSRRSSPPKTPADHAYIWSASEKAHRTWLISGPIVAFVTNWKAWIAVISVAVWFNKPEILAALTALVTGK